MPLSDIQSVRADDISLSKVQGAQDRLSQTRRLEYAEGMWVKSQSMDSKLSTTVSHDSISECMKWYSRTDKREFQARKAGIGPNPYASHGFDRRALFTKPYEDAYIADTQDLLVSDVDPFAVVEQQLQYALGRLTDQVILQAMTDKVIVEKVPVEVSEDFTTAATRTDEQRHYTGQGQSLVTKQITFLPSRFMTGNDTGKAELSFGRRSSGVSPMDDLEELMNVFRKRDKTGVNLFCTYTPELQLRLRTDAEFKNAENIYNGRDIINPTQGMGGAFMYKNITFVPINEDALPLLSTNGGIETAVSGTGKTANATIRCRSMRASDVDGKVATAHPAKSATNREVQNVQTQDLVYFWEKDAVKLARQGTPKLAQKFTEVRFRLAPAMYSEVRLGGLLMDEDCVVVTPLNGQRVA